MTTHHAIIGGRLVLNAMLAGFFIGMAATVYLATPNPIIGAILFGFGLLTILCYEFKLFTGSVGYLANQGRDFLRYCGQLLLIWGGNLAGCFLFGMLIRQTRSLAMVESRAISICEQKLADGVPSLFVLALFCGVLMYLAVETFHRQELGPLIRIPMVFLCVIIFILSGFEHCIATMFYFSVAGLWDWLPLGCVAVLTLGNALGGMMIPAADKLRR